MMNKPKTAWDSADSDPIKDIQDMAKKLFDRGLKPMYTMHHPNCKAVKTQLLSDCNCGGCLFRYEKLGG